MMRQTFIYIVMIMTSLPSVAHEDRQLFDFSQVEGFNLDLYLTETSTGAATPVKTGTTESPRPNPFDGIVLDPVFDTTAVPTTGAEVDDRLETSQATSIPSPKDHGALLVVIIILLVILIVPTWGQFYLGLRLRRNREETGTAVDATAGKFSAGTSETSNEQLHDDTAKALANIV